MRLGVNVWRARQLPALEQQLRKPWVILNDARSRFEASLGLSPAELLLFLAQQLSSAVGLAHVSGNVYVGPTLEDLNMSSEQVLLANVFSHGEIGIDAIASPNERPDSVSLPVLQSLATYSKLRWLSGQPVTLVAPSPDAEVAPSSGWAEVVKPVRPSALKKFPRLSDLLPPTEAGTCLQHSNFIHHDISGDSLEECQISAARIASNRAYTADSGSVAGGCALLTSTGFILSGSEINGAGGAGGVSPLQCALVSLGANGMCPSTVLSVAYVDPVPKRWNDETLRAQVIPQASFQVVDIE